MERSNNQSGHAGVRIPESLADAIRQRKAILFAGAGLSCALGLPLFDALTNHLADKLGLSDHRNADFPLLAEYYLLQTANQDELVGWMKETWNCRQIDIQKSKAHNAIVDLNFPVIYTTNYDSWLERAFCSRGKPFRKIIDVATLAEAHQDEVEIIKFHGDFEEPSSMVLTESSFLKRMSLDGPLDIRLRADSLARPLLFVGYSLSDPNIRYLLYRLQQLWAQVSEAKKKPQSYILLLEPNKIQEKILCERGVEPIISRGDDATAGLIGFFEALQAAVEPS